MPRTIIREVELQRDNQGNPLHFIFRGRGSGNSRSSFIRTDHAPPFDGYRAWAEIEKVSARPWLFYRIVRFVDAPANEIGGLGITGRP